MTKEIISEIEDRTHFFKLLSKNPGLIIIKFGADWCTPCKKIEYAVNEFFLTSPHNVLCADLDVDDSFDVYAFLKYKKMVNGVPAILCYKKGNETYIPDDSVIGADLNELGAFFQRCQHFMW